MSDLTAIPPIGVADDAEPEAGDWMYISSVLRDMAENTPGLKESDSSEGSSMRRVANWMDKANQGNPPTRD